MSQDSQAEPATSTRGRSIDQLIALFDKLHANDGPMSMRELIQASGVPRSSVYGLVNRLAQAGWLASDADGKVFFGRAMHYYGLDYADHNSLIKRARPIMRRLAAAHGETAQLCMLDGNKYTVMLNEHGARTFSISSEIGVKVPIPWTASGRVLLRDLSRAEVLALIPPEDYVLPRGERIDPEAFMGEIDQARHRGYAMTEGLVDSFACCMAAGVTDAQGKAIATLCFTIGRDAPHERRHQLVQALMEAARSLSH